MWKRIGLGVAGEGEFGNRWAAGIGKTEDFGDFIKTFTDSVVACGADDFELVMGGHVEDLGVSARDGEGKKREFGNTVRFEPVGINMGFEVVDSIKWFVPKDGKGTSGECAD